MRTSFLVLLLVFASRMVGFSQDALQAHQPKLTPQTSGTTQLLISVSPVDSHVVWAAGGGGTYVVTKDGGETWRAAVVPGAESLQFRDVHAVSDREAYLLSTGNHPTDFRIYKTEDGGATWNIEFTNHIAKGFLDCFAFWDPHRGLAHDDSVNGVFPDLRTTNGTNWESISANMPPALPGEASFAASGTCITVEGDRNAWITTGGSTVARILATRDGGDTWNAYDTPLRSSASAGGISVAFRDPSNGIVGGGDLTSNADADAAISNDGGVTWTLTTKPPVEGSIFCLSYVRGNRRDHDQEVVDDREHDSFERTVVITAEAASSFTSGSAAWTPDEGRSWFKLPNASGFWAVGFANPHAGWFVGNKGKILKISF